MKYTIGNHKVHGKILMGDGRPAMFNYDDAMKHAEKHDGSLIKTLGKRYIVKIKETVKEDGAMSVPTNNVGSGLIAGVNPTDAFKRIRKKLIRRKTPDA